MYAAVTGGDNAATLALGFLLDDIDGDGHVDLVVPPITLGGGSTEDWVGGVSWNDGSGDFSDGERLVIVPTPGIPAPSGNPVPYATGAVVASDIDGDGDKDLLILWQPDVASTDNPGSLQIMVNQGGRVFTDETVARVGPPPHAGMAPNNDLVFTVGNVNNDGCPDLVFHYFDDLDRRELPIWLNDCQGAFSPIDGLILPSPGGRYIPLDYDGDGDLDLISMLPRHVNWAGTGGCSAGELQETDYMDFAVLLNQSPLDTDGDGFPDDVDAFPNDPAEWLDTDDDGIGNNADLDDDGDSMPDVYELANGLDPLNAADASADADGDGFTNLKEFRAGTDPQDAADFPREVPVSIFILLDDEGQ